MITQTKAKIFPEAERGVSLTNWSRSYHTFNFGEYVNKYKEPLGDLYIFNDEMLDANRSCIVRVKEDSQVILLPVAGAIKIKDAAGNEELVVAGQLIVYHCSDGNSIEITNPFDEGLVNFLQIGLKEKAGISPGKRQLFSYPDVNEYLNRLVTITGFHIDSLFTISIGKFEGRGETVYKKKNDNAGIFAFILQGAFETEGRLLHERDGLALWNTQQIEMEALSNDAIILFVECMLGDANQRITVSS